MNTVVSNVRTRVAKAHGQVRTMGLSADTEAQNLAVRGFIARVGAVLAVFMLAFSLLVPTPPPTPMTAYVYGCT